MATTAPKLPKNATLGAIEQTWITSAEESLQGKDLLSKLLLVPKSSPEPEELEAIQQAKVIFTQELGPDWEDYFRVVPAASAASKAGRKAGAGVKKERGRNKFQACFHNVVNPSKGCPNPASPGRISPFCTEHKGERVPANKQLWVKFGKEWKGLFSPAERDPDGKFSPALIKAKAGEFSKREDFKSWKEQNKK